MSNTGREAAKIAAVLAGGAVLGAGLGILFAPKTGSETRRDVARYAKRAQVQATRFSRAVKSGVNDVVERGRAFVQKKDENSVPKAA
ncbi:MAG TPA: YtxH domain-containing protein [Nitrospiraceae bacterium]|jgi:gas vesicle protein|nr:YtxH domain-containing protein [Nitrospiraceae bacterium]